MLLRIYIGLFQKKNFSLGVEDILSGLSKKSLKFALSEGNLGCPGSADACPGGQKSS